MKYAILVGDGMSDYPVPDLGGKTPLEAAKIPHMNEIVTRIRAAEEIVYPNCLWRMETMHARTQVPKARRSPYPLAYLVATVPICAPIAAGNPYPIVPSPPDDIIVRGLVNL